jgi:hypothetical protein
MKKLIKRVDDLNKRFDTNLEVELGFAITINGCPCCSSDLNEAIAKANEIVKGLEEILEENY